MSPINRIRLLDITLLSHPTMIPWSRLVLECILGITTLAVYAATAQDLHPTSGREIAPVMGTQGAPWLDRPERLEEERPDLAVKLLALREGMSVADIGAGSGYFMQRLAREVGSSGLVYATDIQSGMLLLLEKRKRELKLRNVVVVRSSEAATGLASNSIDLALMVDVYHEFSRPEAMLADLLRALKPGGRIALLEYRKEDPTVPILEAHKMSEAIAIREISAAGFTYLRTESALPRQHLLFFEKPSPNDAPKRSIQ